MKKLDLTFPMIWDPHNHVDELTFDQEHIIHVIHGQISDCLYHANRYYVLSALGHDADWHDEQLHASLMTLAGYLRALRDIGLIDTETYWHIYGITVDASRRHQYRGYRV